MKYKVLVAEDELIERKVLCKTLNKYLGEFCEILESKNGREALELYAQAQPQIAILDIEMPGINGLEVARKIREGGKPCAIMFLTGFDKFSYAKQAISVRALEYLLKPYNEKELIFAVEEAMQHASRFAETEPAPAQPQKQEEDGTENARLALIREEIRRYIEQHFTEDISMQNAAQTMGYSEAYFCKLFKQCFRVNFSVYLNEYRIEKAKAMMEDPRINIKDIGIRCGYSDSNYFARVFKRVTGQTPSEYRLSAAEKARKG